MQPWLSLVVLLLAAPVLHLPQKQTLRFIVTGDAGSTHSQLRAGMLAVMQQQKIDGILLVGDNFYPCGVASLNDPQWSKITEHFGPTHLPIYAILGNHDYGDPQEHAGKGGYTTCGHPDPQAEIAASGRVPGWHFPARNYVIESPLVDFVMSDTEPVALGFATPFNGSLTAEQERQWIATAVAHEHARWRIVVGHHTIYSSGMHGRTNGPTQERVRALLPVMKEHGVDLYICGHDHDMELIGHLQHRGGEPLFLVSGAGSGLDEIRPRKAAGEPPTIYPPLPATHAYLGFAVLEITNERLSISFFNSAGQATAGPFVVTK